MTSHKHNGTAYTVRKHTDDTFTAAYRDNYGSLVTVTNKLRRVAVACVQAHIDDDE